MLKSQRKRAAKASTKRSKRIEVQRNKAPSTNAIRRAVDRASGMASIQSPSYELACSTANPWSCTACIPDGSAGTGCFSTKQSFSLATGVGGSVAAMVWQPSPGNAALTVSGSTAATFNFAGNYTPCQSNGTIEGLYASYRPVSSGIRATYVGPTQTDGGVILLGQVSSKVPPTTFNGTNLASASVLCMNYETYPVRNGGQITWRSGDIEEVTVFKDTTNSGELTNFPSIYPYLIVIAFGVASSQSILQIEAITNYEGRFKDSSFLAGGINTGRLAPTEVGWYEKMKNMVNKIPAIVPLLSAGITGYASGGLIGGAMGVLGSLSNGLPAPGRLSSSRNIPRNRGLL